MDIARLKDPSIPHEVLAAEHFGVPLAQVTAEQRRYIKTLRFGYLYGSQGPFVKPVDGVDLEGNIIDMKTIKDLNLRPHQAEAMRSMYEMAYPTLRRPSQGKTAFAAEHFIKDKRIVLEMSNEILEQRCAAMSKAFAATYGSPTGRASTTKPNFQEFPGMTPFRDALQRLIDPDLRFTRRPGGLGLDFEGSFLKDHWFDAPLPSQYRQFSTLRETPLPRATPTALRTAVLTLMGPRT